MRGTELFELQRHELLARDRGCDRGNLTVAYMGSYDLHYKVTSVNPGTREATVAFHAYNELNYVFSHTSTDHRIYAVVGPHVGKPLDQKFSTGACSKTTQTFDWVEVVRDRRSPR